MINAYFQFFNIAIEILSRIKIKGKKKKNSNENEGKKIVFSQRGIKYLYKILNKYQTKY